MATHTVSPSTNISHSGSNIDTGAPATLRPDDSMVTWMCFCRFFNALTRVLEWTSKVLKISVLSCSQIIITLYILYQAFIFVVECFSDVASDVVDRAGAAIGDKVGRIASERIETALIPTPRTESGLHFSLFNSMFPGLAGIGAYAQPSILDGIKRLIPFPGELSITGAEGVVLELGNR